MNFNWKKQVIFLLPAVLLGACASEPTQTEAAFGDSVRSMIRAQTLNQSTLTNPSDAPVEGGDGQKLEGVLEVYRSTAAAPAAGTSGVSIDVN